MAEDRLTRPALPEAEAAWLREAYARAPVILEYGAGGSTLVAAALPGEAVFAVESDAAWAEDVGTRAGSPAPLRRVAIHHVDIGPTGKWGSPTDASSWARYHRYPLSVWDRPDFAQPDLVLIDGRFRAACFLAVLFRTGRPVTVLWDDYGDRPAYHDVERYLRPVETRGRMARFDAVPMTMPPADLPWVMDVFTRQR